MKKLLILLMFCFVFLKSEPIVIKCIHKYDVEFDIDDNYIEIPTSNEIDYSKYRPITNAEEAKAKKEKIFVNDEDEKVKDIHLEYFNNLPLAKTYPMDEESEVKKTISNKDKNVSILKKIAEIIGINL